MSGAGTQDEVPDWIADMVVGGDPPPAIRALFDLQPDAAESFARLRQDFLTERPDGLSPKHKELLLTLLEVAGDHRPGALRHLDLARDRGLTTTELRETLLAVHLFRGMSAWAGICHELWLHWNGQPDGGGGPANPNDTESHF